MGINKAIERKSEIVAPDGRAYHLGLAAGELAQNVFLVGDPGRARRVASYFDKIELEVSNREYLTFTGEYRGLPVSVIGTGIGTDNVEIALVEAYILNEFDLDSKTRRNKAPRMTFIRLGTSGGVQPDIPAGTLAIAKYGLGLDSTGIYYEHAAPDAESLEIESEAARLLDGSIDAASRFRGFVKPYVSKASAAVFDALVKSASDGGVAYETGITVSSPGFYGPSSRFIDGLSNTVPDIKHRLAELDIGGLKVINMEMESSLLFHLAAATGYRAGTICPIISNPLESDSLIDYETAIGQTIETGFAAITALSGSDQEGKL